MAKVSDLASPSATRAILDRFDLAPKKSFGQNFLVNDDVIRKILELSGVSFDDAVLEVGPGIGTLTNALLKHVRAVVAVERDADLPFVLAHTLQKWEDRFHLVKKDALDLKVDDMGDLRPNLFVANLPYSVAATLVLDYFWRFPFIDSATVMVQREVAERMMAKPGTKNYGAYTVKLSMIAEPVGHFIVKPDSFMPRPHVDSAVIRLNRIASIDDEHDKEVVNIASIMAEAAFASRRKTISNSMRTYLSGGDVVRGRILAVLDELFGAAGIDPQIRGERLAKQDYLALATAFLERD
ncbi:MAG: 16S rRNA (adenine(1518)-N(6)/adenine(1519)-N(6))-dimethyltransferase RsmA [Eggerthellaceae bacterium]|nr:16S rRNA (adenine(1518)-N(6)/adenine(1519)-N(6))-dimethyltransferase RsmA [Eggerthellaceae bacterium]